MSDPNREFVLARYPDAMAIALDKGWFAIARGPAHLPNAKLVKCKTEAAAWANAAERIRKQEQQAKEQGKPWR